jgi:hypothetical protein
MAGKRINDYDTVGDFVEDDLFLVDRVSETKYVNVRWGTVNGIVDGKVAAEVQAREQADTTLQENLNTEAQTREQADTTLQENLNTETQSREQADTALGQRIDGEEAARAQGDTNTLAEAKAFTDSQVNQIVLAIPAPDAEPPGEFNGNFNAFVTQVWGKLAYLYNQLPPAPPPDP